MSRPITRPLGADPARADQDVGAGSRAEVEDGLAVVQVGDGGRQAAAERRRDAAPGAPATSWRRKGIAENLRPAHR